MQKTNKQTNTQTNFQGGRTCLPKYKFLAKFGVGQLGSSYQVSPFGDPTFSDPCLADESDPTFSGLTLKRVVISFTPRPMQIIENNYFSLLNSFFFFFWSSQNIAQGCTYSVVPARRPEASNFWFGLVTFQTYNPGWLVRMWSAVTVIQLLGF